MQLLPARDTGREWVFGPGLLRISNCRVDEGSEVNLRRRAGWRDSLCINISWNDYCRCF